MAKNDSSGIPFSGIAAERNLDRGDMKSSEFGKSCGDPLGGNVERVLDSKPGTGISGPMKTQKNNERSIAEEP